MPRCLLHPSPSLRALARQSPLRTDEPVCAVEPATRVDRICRCAEAHILAPMAASHPPEPVEPPAARTEFLTPDAYRRLRHRRRVHYLANLLPSAFRYLRLSREQRRFLRSQLPR
jgi:hypothetical protein